MAELRQLCYAYLSGHLNEIQYQEAVLEAVKRMDLEGLCRLAELITGDKE